MSHGDRTVALAALSLSCMAAAPYPEAKDLPPRAEWPDPLVLLDGTKVASAEVWRTRRRPELQALFQHYMYGEMPPAPASMEARVEHLNAQAFDGKATLRELALHIGEANTPVVHLLVVVPNRRSGPAPVVLGLNFCGNHAVVTDPKVHLPTTWMYPSGKGVKDNRATEEGRGAEQASWSIEASIERGYAVATMYAGEINPDVPNERGGLRPYLRTITKQTGADATATIAAWAWGLHRAIDVLAKDEAIDPRRIAVFGHSRMGKATLLATAFDERIALAIPHQAGCGGTAPSRGKVGESVQRINTSFPHWFCGNFKQFNDQPDRLPFDQHCLAALVAPRPLLFGNAVDDSWANPAGQFEVLRGADPVYHLLGAKGLASAEMPAVGALSVGTLGYFIRPGKHSTTPEDWRFFLDFADRHLGK